jgi:hypothetical protein
MPLRGSPLSRLRREGGAPGGLAKPVPRVHWCGLLRGLLNVAGVPDWGIAIELGVFFCVIFMTNNKPLHHP